MNSEQAGRRAFVPPQDAIKVSAAVHIEAPPERVAALYREVEHWDEIFPATIAGARVMQQGDNWQQIQVDHKIEGHVPNTLIFLSETDLGLEESKRLFDASFLNQFRPSADGGTQYDVTAYISPKGIYRWLGPLLAWYVRRQTLKQMTDYVLVPLKTAAEKERTGPGQR